MTTAAAVQWRKEFRELLPWWCAIAVTMLVCWALMRPDLMPISELFAWALGLNRAFLLGLALVTYAAGAVSLGAISIGSEYSHQTLSQLLAQPAERAQILRVKLVVLAALLTSLGVLAFALWSTEPAWEGISGDSGRRVLIVLPLACGFLLAPWLTMLGHSPLGGAAFTAVLPSILWMAGIYGRVPAELLWTAAAVMAVVGPALTWRTFMRLEVPGSSPSAVDLSTWFSRSSDRARVARTQYPIWALVTKELRLQQGTLILSALYITVWLVMVADGALGLHALTNSPLFVATFVNTILVPLCSGAVASANERQFDVAAWQALLPTPSWKQWLIKAGVALGMSLALAVFLPMFLTRIASENGWRDGMEPGTVLVLCAAALYVSSLSRTGLRALLFTVPAIAIGIVAATVPIRFVARLAQPLIRAMAQVMPFVEITRAEHLWWLRHSMECVGGGLLVLLVVFGYANHRTEDRDWRRVARQFAWLMAYALVAVLFFSFVIHRFELGARPGR